jgi:TonB family protein
MKAILMLLAPATLMLGQSADVPRDPAPATTAPVLVRKVEPEYTAAARSKRVEGVITLYAEINEDGFATNIKVVKSLEPELDGGAIRALQQWKFKPARKAGKPVTVAANIDIDFRLPRYPLLPSLSPKPEDAELDVTDDWIFK